ncbi:MULTISPECIES: DUF3987 domain-containing protein [unclassified Acinetobacter]|uniref:DUF3987 domain-containing protein n=1 Tax=unclassified Acinetobacter TaxID=196816 RepID=UPI0015D3BF4D|nr:MULTISPECIES: DUF3987 domain-containing protein [unclassified Acinetobacter]
MNVKIIFNEPFAASTDPVTGNKTEYHSIEDFAKGCIDEQNLKVKPESYIHPELPEYNCEENTVFPFVNPQQLKEVIGYRIGGIAKKWDITQTPHKEIDSKKVSFLIGKEGIVASIKNTTSMQYVLGTDSAELFAKLAKAGESVIFHSDIDVAYRIINSGMPETIFRAMTGFNQPKKNQDLFIKLDESFKELQSTQIKYFFSEKINELKQAIDPNTFIREPLKQWEELLPLVQKESNASYPIHAFPEIVQNAVKKAAYYNHVPLALAGQTALGLMVYVAQEHAQAPSDKSIKGQPCSFGTLSVFESGGGKDETRNLLAKSIVDRDRKDKVGYLAEKRAYEALPPKEKKDIPLPINPVTLYTKGTTQGIVKAMSRSIRTSFAWQTTEGAMVLGGYSLTSDTMGESLGVINTLIDQGESSSTLHGNDEPEIVIDKRFSVDLCIQDVMAKKALNNEALRHQGFLARFLFAAPEPLARRKVTKETRCIIASEDSAIIAFNELSERLKYPPHIEIDYLSGKRTQFMKDAEADALHIEFENHIKEAADKSGKYHSIRPNALRMIQYSLRVATVLAYFTPELDCIDAKTMQGAIALCTYSLDEWIRYYGKDEETDSDLLLKWLMKENGSKILKSRISTHASPAKLRNKNIRDDALTTLCDCNYVRIEKISGKDYVVLNSTLL